MEESVINIHTFMKTPRNWQDTRNVVLFVVMETKSRKTTEDTLRFQNPLPTLTGFPLIYWLDTSYHVIRKPILLF